jgi:uncharacterized membrane protein YgdD (TMEM256/DUF423 family)
LWIRTKITNLVNFDIRKPKHLPAFSIAKFTMPPIDNRLLQYASLLGASGIAAGAFGAHALKGTLEKKSGAQGIWNTAVLYHLIHSTAMLGLHTLATQQPSSAAKFRLAGNLMLAGVCMFSGSLYGLALDLGPKALLGPTTPIGGLLMIGSWLVLGLKR